MITKSSPNGASPAVKFDHAVVIGGSIAGLSAARVLIDHFARVTIIERDRLSEAPEFRRGVPQSRHVHVLRLRGQQILNQQFPGLTDELVTSGALLVNAGQQAEFHLFGQWRAPRYPSAIVSVACGRPLLESTLYHRLRRQPRITVIEEFEVAGLAVAARAERVAGVRLRPKGSLSRQETTLAADLVVDASGRGSKAPRWLAGLGYMPPRETVVNAFPGYTSRIYERPAGFSEPWETMYIIPTPPDSPRGGVIIPMDRERWLVTLIGVGRHYPPTDPDGFDDYARHLPSPRLSEALRGARPLTKPYGFRRTENRLRHYERLPRYLEGFVVMGDSVCALNPIHAQGMTVAALSSQVLERSLQAAGSRTGLAGRFQRALAEAVAGPWQMSLSIDRRWPATAGISEPLDELTQLRQTYFSWVMRAMVHNPTVAERFFHVQHMVEPPASLFQPAIVAEVLRSTPSQVQAAVDIQPLLAQNRPVAA